jgi:hypothetical protein
MNIIECLNSKTNKDIIRLLIVFISIIFQVTILHCATLWATGSVAETCPLVNHSYKAHLVKENLTGVVGEEIILSFTLGPPQLPQGFFLSVNMKVLQKPDHGKYERPNLLTGFPDTSAVFYHSGIYRYSIVVSLIAKSSCGGVKADTIFKGEVHIKVNSLIPPAGQD